MFNNFANRILSGTTVDALPILPAEIKRIDETEVSHWQAKFKSSIEKLKSIQKDCLDYATYWSVFFDSQITGINDENTQNGIIEEDLDYDPSEYSKQINTIKAETNKKLINFKKKIESRVNEMKVHLESTEKLIQKRADKKVEIGKNEYFFNLYETKAEKATEDEMQLTSKENQEFDNLKTQLRRNNKFLLNIETQMVETFPASISMFNEFVDNISDVVYYDLMDVYNYVNNSFQSYQLKHDLPKSTVDRYQSGLQSLKKHVSLLESKRFLSNNNVKPGFSSVTGSNNSSVENVADITNGNNPKKSGIRPLHLDKKTKNRISGLGIQSDRSSGLQQPSPVNRRRSSYTFDDVDSLLSLEDEDTLSNSGISPSMSPMKSKRSSILSIDSDSNGNRLSMGSADPSRLSLFGKYKRNMKHTANMSPNPNSINPEILSQVTSKLLDEEYRKKVILSHSFATRLYLNFNKYYKADLEERQKPFNYSQLQESFEAGSLDDELTDAKYIQLKAVTPYSGKNVGDLSFDENDHLYLISDKLELATHDGEAKQNLQSWWLGKTLDGRVGKFPADLVEIV